MKSLLSDKFYRILSLEHDSESPLKVIAAIELNPAHEIYKGHFPGNPVVPGVCMIQMIREIISHHVSKELLMQKADEIKFMNLINPSVNHDLKFEINFKPSTDDQVQAGVVISAGEQVFMKFRGTFRTV